MLTKIIKVSLINWHSRVTPATDISFHLWKWTIYSLFEKCHEKQDSSNTCLPSARVLLLGLSSEYSTDIALIGTCIEAWLVLGESSWSDHVAYPGNERNRLLGPWYFAFCSEMASLLRELFPDPSLQSGRAEWGTHCVLCMFWRWASACGPWLRHCGKHSLLMITKNEVDKWLEKRACGNRLR